MIRFRFAGGEVERTFANEEAACRFVETIFSSADPINGKPSLVGGHWVFWPTPPAGETWQLALARALVWGGSWNIGKGWWPTPTYQGLHAKPTGWPLSGEIAPPFN